MKALIFTYAAVVAVIIANLVRMGRTFDRMERKMRFIEKSVEDVKIETRFLLGKIKKMEDDCK